MDDVEDLEGAPGSSKNIRHASPAKPKVPTEDLVNGPSTSAETRVATPTRRKPVKRKNTDPQLAEPNAKVVISEHEVGPQQFDKATPTAATIPSMQVDDNVDDEMEPATVAASSDFSAQPDVTQKVISKAIMGVDLIDCVSPQDREEAKQLISQLSKVDLMEIYPPERISKLCSEHNLKPWSSMDLTDGYNFDLAADRRRLWEAYEKEQPYLVGSSPPCTYFSLLQFPKSR